MVDLGNMMGAFKFVSAVKCKFRPKKYKEYLAKKQEAEEKGKNLMKKLFEPLIPWWL
jgi:DNA polymerase-3 subunit alpha